MEHSHKYGKEPKYETYMQKMKRRFIRHPILFILFFPITFIIEFIKSEVIMCRYIIPSFYHAITIFIKVNWFILTMPSRLIIRVFTEGDRDVNYGFRPMMILMAAGSFLVHNGTLRKTNFMPWKHFDHMLSCFLDNITVNLTDKFGLLIWWCLFGVILAIMLLALLLYGMLSNLTVAVVVILVGILDVFLIIDSSFGDSYLEYIFDSVKESIENMRMDISIFYNFILLEIPFYNLIQKDKDNYYHMR